MTTFLVLVGFIWLFTLNKRVETLEEKSREKRATESLEIPKPVDTPFVPETQQVFASPAMPFENPESKKDSESKNALEYKFGSKIFTAIGGLAVLLGAGFFLRFAIQAGLLTEPMRIVIGALGGAILIGTGAYLKEKYASYSHILAGTGIGVWHISVFASFNYYHFISQDVAYILTGIITAIGVGIALSWNAKNLALFASIGGFLAPLLFGWDAGFPYKMFVFVLILDLALLSLSSFRKWKSLEAITFFGTMVWFFAWFIPSYADAYWNTTLIFAALYALLFLASTVIGQTRQENSNEDSDFLFPILNATFFSSVSYSIIHPLFPAYMGLVMALLGSLYILLGLIFGINTERTAYYRHYMVGIGLMFIAIAIPIQFDHFAITMLWAIKALLLATLGFYMSSYRLRVSSSILSFFVLFRLVFIDSVDASASAPFLNDRFITFLIVFACSALIAALYWAQRERTRSDSDTQGYVLATHAAILVAVLGIGLEISDFFNRHWISVLSSTAACIAALFSVIYRARSLAALSVLGYLCTLFYITFVEDFGQVTPFLNLRVFVFLFYAISIGVTLMLMRKEYLRAPEKNTTATIGILSFLLNASLLIIISTEIYNYFQGYENLQQVSLSVAWLIYALIVLGIGITKRLVFARQISIALCAIVVVKVFAFDSLGLSNFYRFVSFMTLGLILLLVGFIYNKYKTQITQFIKGD